METMSRKVLITGANGFVGSYLVEESLRNNYLVYAGVRKSSDCRHITDPRVNFLYYDFNDEDKLRSQLVSNKFDYIIHNAGVTAAKNKETYFKVNSGYTRKLCKILLEEKVIPIKFIFVSSLASFGPADLQMKQILDEDSTPHPVTWYGESKLQAEQFIKNFRRIPHLIFSPTAVYGPRSTEMVPVYKTIKRGISPKIGSGDMDASFIHVKDLARLIVSSMAAPALYKSYFVTDGQVYPIQEFNRLVATLLGTNAREITIPFGVMKVVAGISELFGKISGKTPLIDRNKVQEYFARSFAVDTSYIEKDFNFAADYSLEEGLKETLDWCNQHKLL